MTTELTTAEVRRMASAALIEQLDELADLDLMGLDDELVLAMPIPALTWRRDKLLASRKRLSQRQVADVIGLGDKHVQRLRSAYLNSGVESYDALPAPDPELSDDDVRKPGDGRTGRGGAARWTLGVIVRWLVEWERVDPERNGAMTLVLRPGGRKPPGRTPASAKVPAPRAKRTPATV